MFVLGMLLVAAVAGYRGFVGMLRLRPVPPVPEPLPLRAQRELRELRQCMRQQMEVWSKSRLKALTNPDGSLPQELFSEQREFFQQERAMAQCIVMLQKNQKQPEM